MESNSENGLQLKKKWMKYYNKQRPFKRDNNVSDQEI